MLTVVIIGFLFKEERGRSGSGFLEEKKEYYCLEVREGAIGYGGYRERGEL